MIVPVGRGKVSGVLVDRTRNIITVVRLKQSVHQVTKTTKVFVYLGYLPGINRTGQVL